MISTNGPATNVPVSEESIFKESWGAVEEALDYFMSHSINETKQWFTTTRYIAIYTLVYRYCVNPRVTSPNEPPVYFHGELLYKQLEGYLSRLFTHSSQRISTVKDYLAEWDKCVVLMRHCEAIFLYIERHWVERSIQQGAAIHRIKQLSQLKWAESVIKPKQDLITSLVKDQCTLERSQHSLEFNPDLQSLSKSLFSISADILLLSNNRMEPSKSVYYVPLMESIYLVELEEYLKSLKLSDLDQLRAVSDEELVRAKYYLHEKSVKAVQECLDAYLFTPNMPLLSVGFRTGLQSNDQQACFQVFKLLEPCKELLFNLDEVFAVFMNDHLEHACRGDLINGVLKVFHWSIAFINSVANGRPAMLTVRDNAVRAFLKRQQGGRIHELLASQLNMIVLNDYDIDRVQSILSVFKLLEEKETFRNYYSQYLCNRLLSSPTTNIDKESMIVDLIKGICGSGYVSGLQKMLADAYAFTDPHVKVITCGSWPIHHQTTVVKWPGFIEQEIAAFSKKYLSSYRKRKLEWLPHLSKLTVDYVNGRGDKYEVSLNAVQFAILEPLISDGHVMALESIARCTNIPTDVLDKELFLMCSKGFLLMKSNAKNQQGYLVNPNLSPKSINLFENDLHEEPQNSSIHFGITECSITKTDDECKLIIQAAIVRQAKKLKSISISRLIEHVLSFIQPWIPNGRCEEIMAEIEKLIEKEYLKRSKTPDCIDYLP